MAALSDAPLPRVIDLRQLRAEDLDGLLAEEIVAWQDRLDWDFRASAELVQRFVQMQALTGYGLVMANRVVGYAYYVCEERKGLIGDLYVMRDYRSTEHENLLLGPVLESLTEAPWVKRVESQLMMLGSVFDRVLPLAASAAVYPRSFMATELGDVARLPPSSRNSSVAFETWTDRHQDEAARVIAAAYQGHIDSQINDQYRSVAGARRFLLNIVQYPGCGLFFQPASVVAIDLLTNRLCGLCLASLVNSDVGHITQICVTPDARATGVGYELLRRSLQSLRKHGCRKASLTVTTSNRHAIQLYERVGFHTRGEFAAYVWDGF